jgi:hypothetical protein
MRRSNARRHRYLGVVGRIVLPLCMVTGTVVYAQDERDTSQGTVNIALANANGIVLLTDSVQSYQKADGWHHLQPVQKLFRLDDKTVCSIAGFAAETGWIPPELNTEVTGIIANVKDQLSQHPVPELDAKLHAIGFLVGFYIDLVANRHEVISRPGTPSADYEFEVIVAGYDADGKAKLEKLVLTPVIVQAADGRNYWSHKTSLEVATLGRKLAHLLGGIKVVSLQVLKSPEQFSDSAAIRKYARSETKNGGESLSLNEMAALASQMAAQTARRPPFVGFVGGPDQIAILTKGRILTFDQPHFPDPPRPMRFILMVGLKVEGGDKLVAGPGVYFLWIRSKLIGMRNPPLRLDGQFFYGCEIRDSMVEYAGGLTDFGPTNTVVNTMILPGYPVISTTQMLRIMNGFKWTQEPPSTPPLPFTISPQ